MNDRDPVRAALADLEELREKQVSPVAAKAMEVCIDRVRTALGERRVAEVTLREAAEIGGYSYSRLQECVAEGIIENVGEPGAPRIRLSEVPVKPGESRGGSREPEGAGKGEALDAAVEDIRKHRGRES